MGERLLVVDGDDALFEEVRDALNGDGVVVSTTGAGDEALRLLDEHEFDAVLTDLDLDGMHGLELCERITTSRPDVPVVVATEHGNMDTAVAAIRVGADDFVSKPLDAEAVEQAVKRAIERGRLRREVKRIQGDSTPRAGGIRGFVGESSAMKRVFDLIRQVSRTDASVLITGESGTGKELVARALHRLSHRSDGPFVAINCAAMPANLLESQLFGHVKGAFTDAKEDRTGLISQASGGTLFMDEIGDMPLEMQPKLLRVLQEQRLRPVGGNTEVSFDTRILSSTNRDLDRCVDSGEFREDLFYRINVVRIDVPPLRSRGTDVLLLAQHFVEEAAENIGKSVTGITAEAAQKLRAYDWPGNVRELQNYIERAVTLTKYEELVIEDLPEKVRQYASTDLVISGARPEQMPTLAEVERRYVNRVLRSVDGNKTRAAKILGLDRRTLYRRLERFERE